MWTSLLHFKFAGRVLLLFWIAAFAISGKAEASSANWVIADLDGDHRPDLIELHRSFLNVRLHTGKQQLASISGDPSEKEIAVFDVDGDHDVDIVIGNRFLNTDAAVWVND